ncbi:MAG: Hsp20/alpha crystallin family protein [Thaumarchaeota archaeon]|nr:Hsp20/alpha crystallin family protein [Nitrososphaerota archaeon]MCY3975958.1 Hsp20/alpha crystallin family protein [Nitrososphaerota archaeon]
MNMAKQLINEIGNKSREFYEFVLPPIDMHMDDNNLIVIVDMPGFDKKNIKLSIHNNILAISAIKKNDKGNQSINIIWKQRPAKIEKKILLPVNIKDDKITKSAKYLGGILTISLPRINQGKNIEIE